MTATAPGLSQAVLPNSERSNQRLVAISAGVGLLVVSVDLDTLQLPSSLPLSSLSWLVLGAAWLIPATMVIGSVRFSPDGAILWLLSLFGLAVMSALWSIHPLKSLAAGTVSLATLFGAMAATSLLGWSAMVRIASAALGAFALLGLARDVAVASLLSRIPSVISGEERFAGLSFSPTDLSRIACFAVLLSLLATTLTVDRERRFHAAAAVVGLAALLTSGTRLAGFALLCVAVAWIAGRRNLGSLVVLVGVIAVDIALALDPLRFVDWLGRPGESDAHVLQFAGRTPVWSAAFDMWVERPVLGFGWAANELVFQEAFVRDAIGFNAYTAHNVGVGVLVDTGIMGVTLLILALVALWRSTRHTPGARLILLLVLLTGTIEATLSRPNLVDAMLGIVAVAGATAANDRWATVDG